MDNWFFHASWVHDIQGGFSIVDDSSIFHIWRIYLRRRSKILTFLIDNILWQKTTYLLPYSPTALPWERHTAKWERREGAPLSSVTKPILGPREIEKTNFFEAGYWTSFFLLSPSCKVSFLTSSMLQRYPSEIWHLIHTTSNSPFPCLVLWIHHPEPHSIYLSS